MIINIIFTIAFLFTALYLGMFLRFTFRFRRLHPELWRRLDCPESFGIQGQATYLILIMGLDKRVSKSALHGMRREIVVIRLALLIGMIALCLVAFKVGE